jgi:indole-3-glycerol phosphate synthase
LQEAHGVFLVAECEKASLNQGFIVSDYDPVALANIYEKAGACHPVLTDTCHFQGTLAHLRDVCEVVALPVLRKDFNFYLYQSFEVRVTGGDAVLLIAVLSFANARLSRAISTDRRGMCSRH